MVKKQMQNNRRHHIKKNLRKNFSHGKVCHLTDTGMWSKLKSRNKIKERRTDEELEKAHGCHLYGIAGKYIHAAA